MMPEPAGNQQDQSAASLSPGRRAWHRFLNNRRAVLSSVFLIVLTLAVLGGPLFSNQDSETHGNLQYSPPQWNHWLGTDVHGRDMTLRVLQGTRLSLVVGLVGSLVSLTIGVGWGMIAGYFGGAVDHWMMRIVDVLYSLPSVIFVIVLMTTLETSLLESNLLPDFLQRGGTARVWLLVLGLGFISWLTMARIVRGQVLSLRKRTFVEASRILGASHLRILWSHILPNILGVVITYLMLTVPSIILYESFLSYLGLGVQPPQASLGSLLAEGASLINPIRTYWWMIVFPSLFLAGLLMALNFIGDGLRDVFDPQSGSGRI